MDDGILTRIRANPRLAIAIAAGAILVLAWIGWAIYVASDRGATEGLGVLIAWPALIAAAVIVLLPFVGGFLVIRRRGAEGAQGAPAGGSHGGGDDAAPSEDSAESGGAETEAEPSSA